MKVGLATVFALLLSTVAFAEDKCPDSESCEERFSADFRIRYGNINDHNDNTKNANTVTGRLLLTLKTPQVGKFNAVFAAEHVNDFGIHNYNDGGSNGQFEYATEADPSGTEMDEAFIQYRNEGTQIRYGRQYVNHGALPQRFLGTVAWRQNNHTYDALTVNVKPNDSFSFEGALIEKVYRLLGRDHPNRAAREWDLDGIALRGSYTTEEGIRFTGFMYDLDFDDNKALSRTTFGAENAYRCNELPIFRWEGDCKVVIAAQELDHNPYGYDAGWLTHTNLSIGVDFANFNEDNDTGSITFSKSGLEGDGLSSFKTPLATLHGYAGAADKFLVHTPPDGLSDYEIKLKERFAGWNWTVALHAFTTTHQFEPKHYGNELDFAATRTFGQYKWLVKFANYWGNDERDDGYGQDATKLWLQVQFKL